MQRGQPWLRLRIKCNEGMHNKPLTRTRRALPLTSASLACDKSICVSCLRFLALSLSVSLPFNCLVRVRERHSDSAKQQQKCKLKFQRCRQSKYEIKTQNETAATITMESYNKMRTTQFGE